MTDDFRVSGGSAYRDFDRLAHAAHHLDKRIDRELRGLFIDDIRYPGPHGQNRSN